MKALRELGGSVSGLWKALRSSEHGLTTLEYVIGAGVILVVLAGAILAWNNGLATRIGELVRMLLRG